MSDIFTLASVGRKWMLVKVTTGADKADYLQDRTAVLVGDDQNVMGEVLELTCRCAHDNKSEAYGKLKVGKRFWLTRAIIGTKHLRGVAVTDDEAAIDEVLGLIRGSQDTIA
jgi:hypothetical protein